MQTIPKTPKPRTCEWDGYWEDQNGREHYWHCENRPAFEVTLGSGVIVWVCHEHREEAQNG